MSGLVDPVLGVGWKTLRWLALRFGGGAGSSSKGGGWIGTVVIAGPCVALETLLRLAIAKDVYWRLGLKYSALWGRRTWLAEWIDFVVGRKRARVLLKALDDWHFKAYLGDV